MSFQDQTSEASFTEKEGKRLLSVPQIKLKEKGAVFIQVSKEQEEAIHSMIEEFRREYREQFERGSVRPILRWEQEVSDYDFPTLALNKWNLSLDSKIELKKLGLGKYASKLKAYAEENGLLKPEKRIFKGWSEVELTDYLLELSPELIGKAMSYLTPEEKSALEEERRQIQKLLENEKQIAEKIFFSEVHVDEMGYFSNCPPYCDDCFWLKHVKREYIDAVRSVAEKFFVRSHRGKTYTYYLADDQVLVHLIKTLPKVLEEEKNRLNNRLVEIESLLTNAPK